MKYIIIVALSAIVFSDFVFAKEKVKEEFLCKIANYMACNERVGVCFNLVGERHDYKKNLVCLEDFKNCVNTVTDHCTKQ